MHQLHINTEHHSTSYVYSHIHAQIYKTCTQPFGESRATKAGSNRGSNECHHCCTEIAIGTFTLYMNASSITYTPRYQHPTLSMPYIMIRDCWPLSYKHKRLTMRTVIWIDSTTFKRNRYYNNQVQQTLRQLLHKHYCTPTKKQMVTM